MAEGRRRRSARRSETAAPVVPQEPPAGLRSRRRKVRKRKVEDGSLDRLLRRMALLATLGGAVIYGLGVRQQVAGLRDQLGPYSMAADAHDLRGQLGQPDQIGDGGRLWTYRNGERTLTFQLNEQQRVERIACSATAVKIDACPLVGTIGLSSSEADVRKALGRPSTESTTPSTKVLNYAGLGYQFQLGRGQVQAITLDHGAMGWPYLSALLWRAVP